jgi:hypothetical protein
MIGSAILLSKPAERSRESKSVLNDTKVNINHSKKTNQSLFTKKEVIDVLNNHSDIAISAELIEDMNGQVLLNLSYKLKGKQVTCSIDSKNISELRNLFRFREEHKDGYRIIDMILNIEMKKIYFKVEKRKNHGYYNTSIYSYDLQNSIVNKVYYDIGLFGEFYISPDGKFNAFTYRDKFSEKTIIIRCQDDGPLLIDQFKEDSSLYSYSYDFMKWKSNSICELKQKILIKDGSQTIIEKIVFYNVITNALSY